MNKKPGGEKSAKPTKRKPARPSVSPRVGRTAVPPLQDRILVLDSQGKILESSPANPALPDRGAQKIIGRTLQELFAPAQADLFLGQIRRVLKERKPIPAEFSLQTGGQEAWFSATISPKSKESVIWVTRDISELKKAREAAQKAEQRYLSLFENSLIGVYQSTPDGRILGANPPLVRMLGYESLDELLKTDIEKNLYVDASVRRKNLETLKKKGRLAGAEFELRRKDGRRITVSEHAHTVTDGEGRILAYEGTLIDITARNRAQEAVVESERRFRIMADSAPVLMWISDARGGCTFFNQGWLDFTGRTLDQVLGDGWTADVHPDDLPQCWQTYQAALQVHQPFRMEYRLRRADGVYQWILDTGLPRFESDGSFQGYIGSGTDLTELKVATEALKHSEEKHRYLFENSPVGIYRSSLAEGTILDCNHAILKMFGVPDLKGGRTLDTYLNPGDRERMKNQILKKGVVENFETQLKRADGSPFWASISAKLREGEEVLEGVITDITEHKQAERALRESEDRYRDLVEHSHDLICTHDLEGKILSANEAALKLLGYSQTEIVGKNIRDFLPPEVRRNSRRSWQPSKAAVPSTVSCRRRPIAARDASGNIRARSVRKECKHRSFGEWPTTSPPKSAASEDSGRSTSAC